MKPTFITFYSFKGGVGRTQALANVAVALANRGNKVILVDLDLESPGLHMFFEDAERRGPISPRAGVLEFLEKSLSLPVEPPNALEDLRTCAHPRLVSGAGSIHLIVAGNIDHDYERRVSAFSWDAFYREGDGYRFIELFRTQLAEAGPDYVLLDSRTGVNDVGQICTFQLPDVVVAFFALHRQGIEGTRRLAEAIQRSREAGHQPERAGRLLLVPARVDETNSSDDLRVRWLAEAQQALQGRGEGLFELHDRIPYTAQIAFGEQILIGGGSLLSESYERLVDRLVGKTAESSEGLPALRDILRSLATELELAQEERQDPPVHSLDALLRWTNAVTERRASLLRRLGQAQRLATRLHEQQGPQLRLLDEKPPHLDRVEAIQAQVDRLTMAGAAIDSWIQARSKEVHDRLLHAADGDEPSIEPYYKALQPLVEEGNWPEAWRRLGGAEQELSRESIPALLRRGELDTERLLRSKPDGEKRGEWIRSRLDRWVAEPAGAPDSAPIVAINLLDLGLAEGATPGRMMWAAYESLQERLKDDPLQQHETFKRLGLRLWRAEWERILGQEVASDLDYPVGRRDDLESAALEAPGSILPIVELVRGRLVALWTSSLAARGPLHELFRRRHDDPILRLAIERLPDEPSTVATRRGLLAAWLAKSEHPEHELALRPFLSALVEEQRTAEAFYSLVALDRRGSNLRSDPSMALIWGNVLADAIANQKADWVQAIVGDKEIMTSIVGTRSGLGLMAAMAGGWFPAPEDVAALIRSQLLHQGWGKERLPDATQAWLKVLEQGTQSDAPRVNQARALLASLQTILDRGLYTGWQPSPIWERELREFANQEVEKILHERSRDAAVERIDALDGEVWRTATYRKLRAAGVKTSEPDGGALRALQRHFPEIQEVLAHLAALVPQDGRTLASHLSMDNTIESSARSECAGWLIDGGQLGPLEQGVLSIVRPHLRQSEAREAKSP